MATLAIRGHETRGSEIIGLLEMLGGNNPHNYIAYCESMYFYIRKETNEIYYDWGNCPRNRDVYLLTLEQFFEKFPYKIGDKVLVYDRNLGTRVVDSVTRMRWCTESNCIFYDASAYHNLRAEELQPYTEQKEETMEEKENSVVVNNEHKQLKVHSLRYDKVQLMIDDKYELKQEGNAYYIVKKQPQYPKTYKECCKILNTLEFTSLAYCKDSYKDCDKHYSDILGGLRKLLICRDAYWKIAGDWKPDAMYGDLYCIGYDGNIVTWKMQGSHRLLAFPAEEMRDAFYENFKELIEQCKELL